MTPTNRELVIIGAAGGMGRWLCRHLFAGGDWSRAVLLDIDPAVHDLDFHFLCPTVTGTVDYRNGFEALGQSGSSIDLDTPSAHVCIAVPESQLPIVTSGLLSVLRSGATVFDVSSAKQAALSAMRMARNDLVIFGIHPLFGPSVASMDGQTVVVCPDPSAPNAHDPLAELVSRQGGVVQVMSPAAHDAQMAYVQTAAHQALLLFARVLANSGHAIDEDFWPVRTPVFELLLSLAARVLSVSQQETTASIQLSTEGARVAAEFKQALHQLATTIHSGDAATVAAYLASTRDAFGGSFFASLREISNLSVEATQRTRSELAAHLRSQAVIAVEHLGADPPTKYTVGRIRELTPTSVAVESLLAGTKGRATVLDGAGLENAPRLGVAVPKRPRIVRFGIAHIQVCAPSQLDEIYDEWLGRIPTDVRLVVPKAVKASVVVAIAQSLPGTGHVELVSQSLRSGRREVIIRLPVRADRDPRFIAVLVARHVEKTVE